MKRTMIKYNGNEYGHQQVQALMRDISAFTNLCIKCQSGVWFVAVPLGKMHYGTGSTLWLALADCLAEVEKGYAQE